jgi:hypothetical protein
MVELDRRRGIAGIGLAAGSAAVAPLLHASVGAAAEGTDPDALLKAGRFDEAARGYEEILQKDPNNAHAVRQRGYIALLSNRFADAEKYLTLAVRLAPDDKQAKQWLVDCYLRQDKYPPAVPLLRAIGDEPEAKWYEAVQGQPVPGVHRAVWAGAVAVNGPAAGVRGVGERPAAEEVRVGHRQHRWCGPDGKDGRGGRTAGGCPDHDQRRRAAERDHVPRCAAVVPDGRRGAA